MIWLDDNRIKVDPPKRPKKLTGTRFASALGLNRWSSPFATWCEITRTYQEEFEDTIYTIAGKTIEPKQAQFMKDSYFMKGLVSPEDVFGSNFFDATRGDFFHDTEVFGGMWDYLSRDGGDIKAVLEMKTTKRAEDWQEDVPEYYALQAALYAYLLGVDQVIMVASFLNPSDYANPEDFVCSVHNTIVRPFEVSERYPNFEEDYVKPALLWWDSYVKTGVSPQYDESKDKDILAELRKHYLSPGADIEVFLEELDSLETEISIADDKIRPLKKRRDELKNIVKEYSQKHFRDGDRKVELSTDKYVYTTSLTEKVTIDKAALKRDGILDKYSTSETTYRLTTKEIQHG